MPNMLVMGRQLCGKTTTLAAFGQAIISRFSPEQAQITIIDPKTTLIGKSRARMCALTPIPPMTSTP